MNKYFCILLCALIVLTGAFGQALAATMEQVDGLHPIEIHSKLKVKKAGKGENISSGDILVTSTGITTGNFLLDDYATPDIVSGISTYITGTLELLKEKKVIFELDSAGYNAIAATIFHWASNVAAAEGIIIYSAIVYIILPLKTGKFTVDKDTGLPKGRANLKFKGWVEADTSIGLINRNYSYKAKVEF